MRVRSGDGWALLLMRTWGVHQKIFLDESKTQVLQTEVYDTFGTMLFQINFQEMQLVGGFKVPYRVAVSNDRKALVELLVERYGPTSRWSPRCSSSGRRVERPVSPGRCRGRRAHIRTRHHDRRNISHR